MTPLELDRRDPARKKSLLQALDELGEVSDQVRQLNRVSALSIGIS